MAKIVTACKQGLVRSVGLADVLKMHFEPVDVIPLGLSSNSQETLTMLGLWCDWFIVMEAKYASRVPQAVPREKILVCEVGRDRYGNSHHRELIDRCWRWCRANFQKLGVTEHSRKI